MSLPSLGAAVLLAMCGGILPRATGQRPVATSRDRLISGPIVRTLTTSAVVQLGQDMYQVYIPIYGHAIGLTGSAIGTVLAIYAAAAFMMRFVMPRMVVVFGEERLLAYSLYLTAAGFVLVPMFKQVGTLAFASIVVGAGLGCGQPITTMLVFSQSPNGRSGETLGLRQAVNSAVRMSGPAAFGLIASASGLLPVFLLNACIMCVGGWLARGMDSTDQE